MKMRLAVLGPGRIFRRIMTDLPNCTDVELYAIASRDAARAQEAAREYGAPKWYASYEEMLQDPAVDLVYVATPHVFHKEHTLLCLRAGKPVICEKPFAMNGEEAAEMAACAKQQGLFLMEAFWTRFMPAITRLRELAQQGAFGEIKHIHGDFAFRSVPEPGSRLYEPSLGGGALLDVGIYPLSVISMLLGEPESVNTLCVKTELGVDARTTAQMRFPGGATASLMCAVDVDGSSHMSVYGTKARVEIPDFWHATELRIYRGSSREILTFPPENEGHHHQFDHAAACIRAGLTESPVMPLSESVRLCTLMESMLRGEGIVYPKR